MSKKPVRMSIHDILRVSRSRGSDRDVGQKSKEELRAETKEKAVGMWFVLIIAFVALGLPFIIFWLQ